MTVEEFEQEAIALVRRAESAGLESQAIGGTLIGLAVAQAREAGETIDVLHDCVDSSWQAVDHARKAGLA